MGGTRRERKLSAVFHPSSDEGAQRLSDRTPCYLKAARKSRGYPPVFILVICHNRASRGPCRRGREPSDTGPVNGRRDPKISDRTHARETVRRELTLSARFQTNCLLLCFRAGRAPKGAEAIRRPLPGTDEGIRRYPTVPKHKKRGEGSFSYPPAFS